MSEDKNKLMEILKQVPDPEIPVINIVDLGIVRNVELKEDIAEITITPTYTGCPAMKMIEDDIKQMLKSHGYKDVKINTVLSPAWTTDWISKSAREKLREYGIAPPEGSADKNFLLSEPKVVKCPRCGSENTLLVSQFGSTACKALYQCQSCKEPFDYFKCI